MNSAHVTGFLGSKPELRTIATGAIVTNLNVAVNRNYTDQNGNRVQNTVWMDIAVWGAQAQACVTYLDKGSAVAITGTVEEPRAWVDKVGVPHARATLRAEPQGVVFMDRASQANGIAFKDRSPQPVAVAVPAYADDSDGLPPA